MSRIIEEMKMIDGNETVRLKGLINLEAFDTSHSLLTFTVWATFKETEYKGNKVPWNYCSWELVDDSRLIINGSNTDFAEYCLGQLVHEMFEFWCKARR